MPSSWRMDKEQKILRCWKQRKRTYPFDILSFNKQQELGSPVSLRGVFDMLPCHSMCHLRGRIPGTSECICPLACDLGLGTLHLLPWKSLRYSVCLCEPRNPNKVRSPLSMCLSIYSKNFNKVVSCNFLYQSYPNVYLGYHPLLIHTLPVLHWIFFFF